MAGLKMEGIVKWRVLVSQKPLHTILSLLTTQIALVDWVIDIVGLNRTVFLANYIYVM